MTEVKKDSVKVAGLGLSFLPQTPKYRKYFDILLENFIGIAFTGMVICVLIGVASRFLPVSIAWSELVARLFNIWVTFIGIGVLIKSSGHIRVNYLDDYLKAKGIYPYYVLVCNIIMLLVSTIIVYGAYRVLNATWNERITAYPVLSMKTMWFAPTIGFGILVIYLALNIAYTIKAIKQQRVGRLSN